ncbi:hypothetical protein PROCH_1787 [Prochlorococcus marinus str. EQPAC1]|nr:hypothetical protein PROCH_1787 [Prochlorococcus marinus str. EQPAC1]
MHLSYPSQLKLPVVRNYANIFFKLKITYKEKSFLNFQYKNRGD